MLGPTLHLLATTRLVPPVDGKSNWLAVDRLGDRGEFLLGFRRTSHGRQQERQFPPQFEVAGVEIDGLAEFVDIGVTRRQKLARRFRRSRLPAPGRRQEGRVRLIETARG